MWLIVWKLTGDHTSCFLKGFFQLFSGDLSILIAIDVVEDLWEMLSDLRLLFLRDSINAWQPSLDDLLESFQGEFAGLCSGLEGIDQLFHFLMGWISDLEEVLQLCILHIFQFHKNSIWLGTLLSDLDCWHSDGEQSEGVDFHLFFYLNILAEQPLLSRYFFKLFVYVSLQKTNITFMKWNYSTYK